MDERMLTLEQMQTLMLVAGADDPTKVARELRGRWRYILGLARAAQRGLALDDSLPQVMLEAADYEQRADAILAALDEWLEARKV